MTRLRYQLAGPEHEAELRALLRELDMPGWVHMLTTREPDYFAAAQRFGQDRTVIGLPLADHARAAGMFASALHPVHLNGQPAQAGYLGALRIRPAWRHRPRLLREGFALVRQLHPPSAQPLWYTAIGSGNLPAQRLLQAGLPGLPRYRFLNELITLALPRSRARRHGLWQPVPTADLPALCAFHASQAQHHQFAPALQVDTARQTGAPFYGVQQAGRWLASMALWDRRAHQQVRALGYRAPLNWGLPLYNAWARLAQRVPLPACGQPLDHAWAAFWAVADPTPPIALLEDALALCPAAALSLSLHAAHPWLPALRRRFRPLEYRTRVYAVAFDPACDHLDTRPAQPEAAVM